MIVQSKQMTRKGETHDHLSLTVARRRVVDDHRIHRHCRLVVGRADLPVRQRRSQT